MMYTRIVVEALVTSHEAYEDTFVIEDDGRDRVRFRLFEGSESCVVLNVGREVLQEALLRLGPQAAAAV